MTTKAKKDASKLVVDWCKKQKIKLTQAPMHVYPRTYVLGYAAPKALIVAQCWIDSEPQVRDFQKENPLEMIYKFDPSLKAGDWCVTAYIVTGSASEKVAVQYKEVEK